MQVRAGDDVFLRNVSNERYLSAQLSYLQNAESDAQKVWLNCSVHQCYDCVHIHMYWETMIVHLPTVRTYYAYVQ